ncbi:hypothetical protein, conserved [Eimeria necatrix]|uniref:K Homology domain-containing protein n=1 Tax=Eimeria necatrix TaxID=51315 RepID=U6MWY4_9EIME|nr:hypothetical protein, conserved [Eimeria necatrix]CDJ66220.1 hypothetical protein, conserved [Eimeria necatrix]
MATEELPVFLPGDYCPLIQQSEGTSAEAAAAASASASAAAATARSFQWSAVYVHPSHLSGKDETQNHGPEPAVEVEEAGPCIKARTASVMLPRHVLPPHGPTYVCISTNNRYSPRVGDIVVGIISSKGSEYYGVNIRSVGPARLATVAGFEGATRRSKPQLSVGSVLLVRVSHLSPLLGADVTCCSSSCSKPWTSNEKVLGELRGGVIVEVAIPFALTLLCHDSLVLQLLGSRLPFEIAVGLNGRVWLRAETPTLSMRVANCITAAAAGKTPAVLQAIVDAVLQQ